MWESIILYGLWSMQGLFILLSAHRPVPAETQRADDQEWILYLQ